MDTFKKPAAIVPRYGKRSGALCALLCLCISISAAQAQVYLQEDYFPLSAGDSWLYLATKNGLPWVYKTTVDASKSPDNQTRLSFTGVDRYHVYTRDDEGITLSLQHIGYKGREVTGSFMAFPAAIEPGETLRRTVTAAHYCIDTGLLLGTAECAQSVTLAAVEPVWVPAGTFTGCLKIIYRLSYDEGPDWQGEQTLVQWFARDIGPVKGILTYRWKSPWEGRMAERVTFSLLGAAVAGTQYGLPGVSRR